jgi:hypothetical protein
LEGDLLDQRLDFFVDFTRDDLLTVLQDSHFLITSDSVSLADPPEIDIYRTLAFLRQISRTDDDYVRASSHNFIAYFHYHRIDARLCPEPPVDNPGACLQLAERPTPEEALLLLFRHQRVDRLTIHDVLSLQHSVVVSLKFGSSVIGHFLGDVVELIGNSPLFQFSDSPISVRSPLILGTRFTPSQAFVYRPTESMPRIAPTRPEDDAGPSIVATPAIAPYDRFHSRFAAFRRALPRPTATFTEADVHSFLAVDVLRGDDQASLTNAVDRWIKENTVEVQPEPLRLELAEKRRLRAVALAADGEDWIADPLFVSMRAAIPCLQALDHWKDRGDDREEGGTPTHERVFRLRNPDSP